MLVGVNVLEITEFGGLVSEIASALIVIRVVVSSVAVVVLIFTVVAVVVVDVSRCCNARIQQGTKKEGEIRWKTKRVKGRVREEQNSTERGAKVDTTN